MPFIPALPGGAFWHNFVKNMSGGRMGEFGYINYLKNNLGRRDENEAIVVEDKFGKKTTIEDM